MAQKHTFDITSGCDLQEVDNAVNQALKELTHRYDFRNLTYKIELNRKDNVIVLEAPDELKLNALWDILQTKMIARKVPVKNLKRENLEQATGMTVRQKLLLQQGLPQDAAKDIVKHLKDLKLKKVQTSIHGDEVRVTSDSIDDLQNVIGILKKEDFGVELNFGNYR